MIFSLQASALALLLAARVSATCQHIAGNTYCDPVKQVVYKNINGAGKYNRITDMDSSSGQCQSAPQPFSGSLSPLHEELTVHFRGPLNLKQFGVYLPSDSNNKDKRDDSRPRHKHHLHKRDPVTDYQTDYVYVTVLDEQPAPSGAPAPVVAPVAESPKPEAPKESPVHANTPAAPSSKAAETSAPASSNNNNNNKNAPGAWKRTAFYDSSSSKADGLVFMNNMGGAGSGVFDYTFGASVSYAGSDAVSCAKSPQVLADVTVGSNKEFMIFSDAKCSDGDCGYHRPGIPAHHGFAGGSKIFVFEFSMPKDNTQGFNADMPAVWLLNAQIPRTLQYGKQACSCWASGCGELDLFEVLNPGNEYLTNHLHSPQGAADGSSRGGGGTPNYFKRPTQGTLKAAAIFNEAEKSVSIVELDPSVKFDSSLTAETVTGWLAHTKDSATEVQI